MANAKKVLKTIVKKRNPQDATLRNTRAANKHLDVINSRLDVLGLRLGAVEERLSKVVSGMGKGLS